MGFYNSLQSKSRFRVGNARLSENIVRVLLDQVVERVYQEHDIDYEFTDEDLSGITKFLNLQLMLGEEINLINF